MITKNMTDSEIVKELEIIENTIMSRHKVYWKRFGKQLQDEKCKHNTILRVQEENINGNKVIICWQKVVLTDQLSDLRVSKMVITEDNYAFLTVRNELGDFVYIRFSYHAFVRMCEREGMTLNDFFINEFVRKAESSVFLLEYKDEQKVYGYDEFTYIMTIGKCFFIVCIDGNKIVVKTDLAWDMLHPNQMALYVDSKRCAEKFASNTYNKDATILNGIGLKNTSDAIRAMCA